MRGVGLSPSLEDLKCFASVRSGHRTSSVDKSVSILREIQAQDWETHFVHRLDTVTEFPFAHAIVKGLLSMVPPQAMPSQPTSFLAITWRTMSYGVEAGFGTAVRMLITSGLLYLYIALY